MKVERKSKVEIIFASSTFRTDRSPDLRSFHSAVERNETRHDTMRTSLHPLHDRNTSENQADRIYYMHLGYSSAENSMMIIGLLIVRKRDMEDLVLFLVFKIPAG